MTCVANDGLSAGEAPTTATPRGANRSASGGSLVSMRGSYSPLELRAGTKKAAAPPSRGALPRTRDDEQRRTFSLGSPTALVNAFVLSAAYSQPHPSPLWSGPCGSGWQTTRTGPWM
jgi:hypothetical protein